MFPRLQSQPGFYCKDVDFDGLQFTECHNVTEDKYDITVLIKVNDEDQCITFKRINKYNWTCNQCRNTRLGKYALARLISVIPVIPVIPDQII